MLHSVIATQTLKTREKIKEFNLESSFLEPWFSSRLQMDCILCAEVDGLHQWIVFLTAQVTHSTGYMSLAHQSVLPRIMNLIVWMRILLTRWHQSTLEGKMKRITCALAHYMFNNYACVLTGKRTTSCPHVHVCVSACIAHLRMPLDYNWSSKANTWRVEHTPISWLLFLSPFASEIYLCHVLHVLVRIQSWHVLRECNLSRLS